MGLLDFFSKPEVTKPLKGLDNSSLPNIESAPDPNANWDYNQHFNVHWDGEKTPGEIGAIKNYKLNYPALRARSWQSYLESEITQDVIKKFVLWIVGSGLKTQAAPVEDIIKLFDKTFDSKSFVKAIESHFKVYTKSKHADHSQLKSLNKIIKTAYINAIVGGDVLVILRTKNNLPTIQLIDGAHIQTPYLNKEIIRAKKRGNLIRHGVEFDKTGKHIAYYIRENENSYKRVLAIGKKTGRTQAFLFTGGEYRIDNVRGVPLIVAVLEALKKLDRYKEATVGSAEERQKIVLAIEHSRESTGENPFTKQLKKQISNTGNPNSGNTSIDGDSGKSLEEKIAFTTQKATYNLPIGASLKQLVSDNELSFKDFYTTNIVMVCAAIGIPAEVALSKYDSNFSASRAALKDWEHTILVNRSDVSEQFYQPVYNLFLDMMVLTNKVPANSYLNAKASGDVLLIEAYQYASFIGVGVPHIDPLKEVKAIRAKLGASVPNAPLITMETAVEEAGGAGSSDFTSILNQFGTEKDLLEVVIPTPEPEEEEDSEPKE